jgi:hypothetical protein
MVKNNRPKISRHNCEENETRTDNGFDGHQKN